MNAQAENTAPFRVGQWLPSDQAILTQWLSALHEEALELKKPLHPVLQSFQALIENDAEIYMLFSQMFQQVPHRPPYNRNPAGGPQVRSYQQMLQMINVILTRAPEFNTTGLVGFPINAILDWSMGTTPGLLLFSTSGSISN